MSPQREIDQETAGGRLALFLVGLARGTPVRELSEKFGRSSSSWGNYLNGAQLIPKQLVGSLVESFTPPGAVRNAKAVRALELWTAADTERRAARTPSGGELVRQHQRRDDALQQVIKYQALAANAEKHLAELRPMLAYTQSRLENAELQLKLGGERERAQVERRLGQARERLSRVRVQQERARRRRMTAEEQQEFWVSEALTAQEEISRLEREAQDLAVVPPGSLEPARQDETDETDETDEVADCDFETRLEHITAEGLEDEALIEEDRQPAPFDSDGDDELQTLLAVQDTVQPVSNLALDKPATSADVQRQAALASVARVLRAAGPVRLAPVLEGAAHLTPAVPRPFRSRHPLLVGLLDFVRLVVLPVPLLTITAVLYLAAQVAAVRSDAGIWYGVFVGTVMSLPALYGSLRAIKVPQQWAGNMVVLLHVAWSVLLLLDRLPWPTPDFSAK